MQAMAQKQVTVVTFSSVSCVHALCNKISNMESSIIIGLLEILLTSTISPALCSVVVCCARHFASLYIYVFIVLSTTWAFYFVIPLSSSLFLLELLLIVSFHSFLTLEPNVSVATPFYVLTDQSHLLASYKSLSDLAFSLPRSFNTFL